MTTLLALNQEVQELIARDDTTAKTMITRGINAGIVAATILYEPPEQRTTSNLTASNGVASVALSGLTRWLRIEEVYNSTGSNRVWPLSYHQLNSFYLPTSGNVIFYALYGGTMYYKPTPSQDETLNVYFLQYPARVSNDGDTLPLSYYEDFILSFSTAFAFASLEEGESEQIWERIAAQLNLPFSALTKVRSVMREELPSGNDLQRALSESSAQA